MACLFHRAQIGWHQGLHQVVSFPEKRERPALATSIDMCIPLKHRKRYVVLSQLLRERKAAHASTDDQDMWGRHADESERSGGMTELYRGVGSLLRDPRLWCI